MKKSALLNQPLSAVIAGMGHRDTLVIADAGLPIPKKPQRIDLAVTANVPRFLDTLRAVLTELEVETAVITNEMINTSPDLYQAVKEMLGDIPIETETHLIFKEMTHSARAVVRTGEFTPYANIILISGVVF